MKMKERSEGTVDYTKEIRDAIGTALAIPAFIEAKAKHQQAVADLAAAEELLADAKKRSQN